MKKHILSTDELEHALRNLATRIQALTDKTSINIYGVPRGGIPVAYEMVRILQEIKIAVTVVYDLSLADFVVDDIVDSGKTRARILQKWDGPIDRFLSLYDKTGTGKDSPWIVFPWEEDEVGSGEDIITRQLQFIGEDVTREGLLETPRRVIKAWSHFFKGYQESPEDILGKTFGKETYDEMVILKDIEFFSHCEHHLVPFYGRVHIAYIPGERVVGISKLARLVECYSRRLQIQERMTEQIASSLMNHLQAQGVAVFVEARHLCMTARGVEKQNSIMVTSSLKGACREDGTRMEFLLLQQRDSRF